METGRERGLHKVKVIHSPGIQSEVPAAAAGPVSQGLVLTPDVQSQNLQFAGPPGGSSTLKLEKQPRTALCRCRAGCGPGGQPHHCSPFPPHPARQTQNLRGSWAQEPFTAPQWFSGVAQPKPPRGRQAGGGLRDGKFLSATENSGEVLSSTGCSYGNRVWTLTFSGNARPPRDQRGGVCLGLGQGNPCEGT